MLTRFDDYPLHQTPEPIAHPATASRNAYDRYWFNGFAPDGSLYFAVALGLYPNRGVMDCAFSLVREGEQRSFFASRRAPRERDELQIGPFKLEVLEPMRRLRVTLADNDSGLACSLEFEARTDPIEEERQVLRREERVFMDVTRFTQFGRWQGSIRCDGQTIAVQPAETLGIRDRSWGVRPVGEPETGGAPVHAAPQIFFLWAPIHWPQRCSHLCVFEDAFGRPFSAEGRIAPASPPPQASRGTIERAVRVAHRINYRPGTRWMQDGDLSLHLEDGSETRISLEPVMRFQMKGLGYRHPEWSHGVWKGELATGADRWRLEALDPLGLHNIHIQQLVRARLGEEVGWGIVEQLCIGPHAPSGFRGLLDGAR